MNGLEELTKCIKNLSIDAINTILDAVKILFASENTTGIPNCPYCRTKTIRYGHKCDKQRFRCKQYRRTFATTTHIIMSQSHFSETVWQEVVSDTVRGNAVDYSAKNYALTTVQYLICTIRYSLHYRNFQRQNISCLTAFLNWMRFLTLNAIRVKPFRRPPDVKSVSMAPKRKNAVSPANMSVYPYWYRA